MNVYELVKLIPKVEGSKIASLDSFEDNIYVGTEDGHVILYSVQEDVPSGKFTFKLEKKKFLGHGKKPVTKLLIFKEIMKLFTLCGDGNVDMLNPFSLEPSTHPIPVNKGVSLMCNEKKSPVYRMCFQVKRKLHLFEFVGTFQPLKEINLTEPAVTMEWYKGMLCLGLKKEYILIDVDTQELSPLFPLEKSTIPIIKLCAPDLLLAKDELGVFITDKGYPTRGNILWSNPPFAIAFRAPYVIALESKSNSLEVHNSLNQSQVQTIPFPQKKNIKFVSEYEGSKYILFATSSVIFTATQLSIDKQVEKLLALKKVPEALQLVEYVSANDTKDVREQKMKKVHLECGLSLFKHLDFPSAFDHFRKSDVDPRQLLAFFPDLMPTSSSYGATGKTEVIQQLVSIVYTDEEKKRNAIHESKVCLLNFLEEKNRPEQTDEITQDVNGALIKLYIELSTSDLKRAQREAMHALLRSSSTFHKKEVENDLLQKGYYTALGLLHKSTGDVKSALEIWQRLGKGELVEEGEDGVDETVKLLRDLDLEASLQYILLLWQFSRWVLEKHPDKGITIFTVTKPGLSSNQVIEFLTPLKGNLLQIYLEFLIYECNTPEGEYHTKLGMIYLDNIKLLLSKPDEDKLKQQREKLMKLLQESEYYNQTSLLAQTSSLPLYEEQIVLYTRLKKYQKALEVLVKYEKDYKRAEEYCTKYKGDDDELTLSLLKVYLREPLAEGELIPASALNLINSHAKELHPVKVLPLLPDSIPISDLEVFFRQSIQHNFHTWRQGQVVKNLLRHENINVRTKLATYSQKSVVVTRDKLCAVCKKKLGDKVFARFPNGVVVHFKCFSDPSICPVTGEDFKKSTRWS